MNAERRVIPAAVAVHLAFSALHGLAHLAIPVHVPAWQYGYAALVIEGLPIAGTAMILNGRVGRGLWVLLLAGIGALSFEGVAHFVVSNPDHVASVNQGYELFAATAGLTVVGDVILVGVAAWGLRRNSRSLARRPSGEASQ